MKTFTIVLLLSVWGTTASAQKSGYTSPNVIMMEVEGIRGTIVSFATTQSAVNGNVVHDITAVAKLSRVLELMPILLRRLSNDGKPSSMAMKVLFGTSATVSEARDYGDVSISSIELPGFNASSKEQIDITIKMKSTQLKVDAGGGKTINNFAGKPKLVLESNFRVKLEELPTNHLSRISALRFLPLVERRGDSVAPFEIWVRGSDGGPWLEWFAQATADPGKTKDGEIILLAPNLKDPIATIQFIRARPTGYADVSSPEGSKAHVHLSAERVMIKFEK